MKRWYVKINDKTMKLYYQTLEVARQHWPDAEITECTETDYLDYVALIDKMGKTISEWVLSIPFYNGFVIYRQFVEDGQPIDGGSYVYCPPHTQVSMLKTLTTPKEFYELFGNQLPKEETECVRMSPKEFKKIKKDLEITKLTSKFYVDKYGRFYDYWTPTKYAKAEYEKFKGNTDAILISYMDGYRFSRKWCLNEEEAKQYSDNYAIMKRGYTALPPDERLNIVRLPYIPLSVLFETTVIPVIMNYWINEMRPYEYFKEVVKANQWFDLEKAIQIYQETLTNR